MVELHLDSPPASDVPPTPPLPSPSLELRVHGRGGQGGITCAKVLAAVYAQLGKSVQTFGDYAGDPGGG